MSPSPRANDPLDEQRLANARRTDWAFRVAGSLMLCGLAASFWRYALEGAGLPSVWGVCPGLIGSTIAIGAMRRTPDLLPSRDGRSPGGGEGGERLTTPSLPDAPSIGPAPTPARAGERGTL